MSTTAPKTIPAVKIAFMRVIDGRDKHTMDESWKKHGAYIIDMDGRNNLMLIQARGMSLPLGVWV